MIFLIMCLMFFAGVGGWHLILLVLAGVWRAPIVYICAASLIFFPLLSLYLAVNI